MREQRGFTLVELMIGIAILVIAITAAAPSLGQLLQNIRTTTQTNDLLAAVNLARSEALQRSEAVAVRATGGDWNNGFGLYLDSNGDGDFADAGDEALRVYGGLRAASLDLDGALVFLPSGWVDASDWPADQAEIKFYLQADDCKHRNRREITISRAGSIVAGKLDCSGG